MDNYSLRRRNILKNVKNAIDNLLLIIKKYQLGDIRPQVETLKYLREILNNDEIQSTREKLNLYKSLFPPHGGLSDLYYWHNDFQIRKKVNDDISILEEIIADYLLER
ncbi:hypothetical protein HMPREF0444_1840 [Granulicatella adiacens ATCC 49175]|jgi:hypothetical protein|uniref:Uncharacterized protein n=1 Tax=Granulicatella adiacens ATCC 49175 TaxID=638301 RepID=C8NIU5_9LACT|nr:hypothetical protein HMPREF0444_1840 [Granulicatella adiacens ATCC 49175]